MQGTEGLVDAFEFLRYNGVTASRYAVPNGLICLSQDSVLRERSGGRRWLDEFAFKPDDCDLIMPWSKYVTGYDEWRIAGIFIAARIHPPESIHHFSVVRAYFTSQSCKAHQYMKRSAFPVWTGLGARSTI